MDVPRQTSLGAPSIAPPLPMLKFWHSGGIVASQLRQPTICPTLECEARRRENVKFDVDDRTHACMFHTEATMLVDDVWGQILGDLIIKNDFDIFHPEPRS